MDMIQNYECGIGLTNKYCSIAVVEGNNVTVVNSSNDCECVTEAAVAFLRGRTVVGKRARNSNNVTTNILRYVENEKSEKYDALCQLLQNLKRDAEHYTNRKIESAVISVPNGMSVLGKNRIQQAAKAVGFIDIALIDEAVAIVNGMLDYCDTNESVAVISGDDGIDFGIVNYRTTLVDNKWNHIISVHRGDVQMVEKVVIPLMIDEGIVVNETIKKLSLLNVEKARKDYLWNGEEVVFELFYEDAEFEMTLQREHFERVYGVSNRMILEELNGFESQDFSTVLLAGELAYTPLLAEYISDYFERNKLNKYVYTCENALVVNAIGAGYIATKLERLSAINAIKGIPEEPKIAPIEEGNNSIEMIVNQTGVTEDYAKKIFSKFDNFEKTIRYIEEKRKKKQEKESKKG